MTASPPAHSARKQELLERAYDYVLEHGLAGMSLRPLAEAVGSSPRVLLFLFGSKDGLVQALLARSRREELRMLHEVRQAESDGAGPARTGELVWEWLAAPRQRKLLTLWVEGYGRSLTDPAGPWSDFAGRTVDDWLAVFAEAQQPERRDTTEGATERTLLLSVLRGALLDLLATGDRPRLDAAVGAHLASLRTGRRT